MDLYACKPSTFCSLCQNINCKVTVKDQQVPFKLQSNPLKNAKSYSQKANRQIKIECIKNYSNDPKEGKRGEQRKSEVTNRKQRIKWQA